MKCKQRLCNRNKNIGRSGHCSVCENVLVEQLKTLEGTKKQVPRKVEVDVELMVNTHNKISRGINVEQEVVSNLLLGGVINILQQHDALEEMEERIVSVD